NRAMVMPLEWVQEWAMQWAWVLEWVTRLEWDLEWVMPPAWALESESQVVLESLPGWDREWVTQQVWVPELATPQEWDREWVCQEWDQEFMVRVPVLVFLNFHLRLLAQEDFLQASATLRLCRDFQVLQEEIRFQ